MRSKNESSLNPAPQGMRNVRRATMVYWFLLAVLLWSFGSTVHAQAPSAGVSIKPTTIERAADPGAVVEETITLTNISSTEQSYFLISKDISGVDDIGTPIFADPGAEITGFELSQWLSFSQEAITLKPNESAQVSLKITVPADASPGSHFGGLFASVQPPRLRTVGAGVGYEVGSIISIRISGDVVESARIREFSTGKLVYGSPNVDFLARIENPGNVLIRPRGPLEINNMFGKRVGFIVVNDNLAGVFPGTTRPFKVNWEDEGLGFGRYQAVVGLIYGESGRQSTVSATVSFWILPVKVIVPVLGVLSLLILVVYMGIKLYVKNALRELSTTQGRRVVARRRRDAGISRLMVVAVTLLIAVTLFLLGLLLVFA